MPRFTLIMTSLMSEDPDEISKIIVSTISESLERKKSNSKSVHQHLPERKQGK